MLTKTKETLAGLIKGASYVALTSDAWTSKAHESYVSLTAHFITNTWELLSFTLCCRAFKEDHTGENIKDFFKEALSEWSIPLTRVTSITIDNGDNIRLAVDLLGAACMRCFGHTVQTGCTLLDSMTSVKELRTAAQKLLTFMSQTKTWNKYEEYMRNHHSTSKYKKLPHPVATRWWSYLPLYRVLKDDNAYHRGFLAVYNNGKHLDLLITGSLLMNLRILVATLSPLEELCTMLAADKYVTASAVLPITYLLEKLAIAGQTQATSRAHEDSENEEQEEDRLDHPDASLLKVILNRLYKRYVPCEWSSAVAEGFDDNVEGEVGDRLRKERVRRCDKEGREVSYKLLVKCSYVDSRYREDLKPSDIECARTQLLDEIHSHVEAPTTEGVSPPSKQRRGLGALFAKLSSYSYTESATTSSRASSTDAAADTPRERLKREMTQYEQLVVEKDADILLWWKVHESSFPLLSKLARKYLAVPATSTESERLFSLAGLVINYLRTCLTGEHAEWLIFLGMNKDHVPKP